MEGADEIRYRAPAESGAHLVDPPWESLPELVRRNAERTASSPVIVGGVPLPEAARNARRELLQRAYTYTQTYLPVASGSSLAAAGHAGGEVPAADRALVMTGHQPGFVHPGVWLKNFAADKLAATCGGTAVHLVIDADLCRNSAVRVPAGTRAEPSLASVPYDRPASAIAWEERRFVEPELWESFATRLGDVVAPLVARPLICDWWPRAVLRGTATGMPGAAISQARHQLEREWGSASLELPQSAMCQLTEFRRFACDLLASLPRFQEAYNGALAAYRLRRRIRNQAHPAPRLAAEEDWREAPLWVWTAEDPTRRPLFARRRGNDLELRDDRDLRLTLPLFDRPNSEEAIGVWGEWESEGIRVRSRALITTLFARLLLTDCFIHGIGGAHYDRVTDAIGRAYFGVAPPPYATVSGTLRLPESGAQLADERPHWRGVLRALRYHPERFLEQAELDAPQQQAADAIARGKADWVAQAKTPANAAERHREITQANAALYELLVAPRRAAQESLEEAGKTARIREILASREYPFCVFPAAELRRFVRVPAP
jgi:hypothetical protein